MAQGKKPSRKMTKQEWHLNTPHFTHHLCLAAVSIWRALLNTCLDKHLPSLDPPQPKSRRAPELCGLLVRLPTASYLFPGNFHSLTITIWLGLYKLNLTELSIPCIFVYASHQVNAHPSKCNPHTHPFFWSSLITSHILKLLHKVF